MNIKQFWSIIEEAKKTSVDSVASHEYLIDNLASLDKRNIAIWQNIFSEYWNLAYKRKLWAAAYIIEGGCSDDGFMDFRYGLIASGKKIYLNALNDPDSLVDLDIDYFSDELIGYAAMDAFNEKVDQAGAGWDFIEDEMNANPLSEQLKAEISSEIKYAKDIDAEWGGFKKANEVIHNELRALLPRLCEKFL